MYSTRKIVFQPLLSTQYKLNANLTFQDSPFKTNLSNLFLSTIAINYQIPLWKNKISIFDKLFCVFFNALHNNWLKNIGNEFFNLIAQIWEKHQDAHLFIRKHPITKDKMQSIDSCHLSKICQTNFSKL
jgi:hypothetical protein